MTKIKQIYTNSLSCEPIMRRMPNGELLCICQCDGPNEPHPDNRVYFFHSSDDGETWSAPARIIPENGRAVSITEAYVLGGEVFAILSLHDGGFVDWDCLLMKSRDNGHTWEEAGPPPCFPRYTFLRSKTDLKNGNILITYQHYPISNEENARLMAEGKKAWDADIRRVETGVMISTDGGKTFHAGQSVNIAIKGDSGQSWAWTEPTVAERADGSLVMLLRIDGSGFLWRCESKDGGESFTQPIKTDIPNPTNKPKLIALPDGKIALIHTPNTVGIPERVWTDRFPLQIWISNDGALTWNEKRNMTDFPGNYDYSDGFYEDGHILFVIERNRHDILFFKHSL